MTWFCWFLLHFHPFCSLLFSDQWLVTFTLRTELKTPQKLPPQLTSSPRPALRLFVCFVLYQSSSDNLHSCKILNALTGRGGGSVCLTVPAGGLMEVKRGRGLFRLRSSAVTEGRGPADLTDLTDTRGSSSTLCRGRLSSAVVEMFVV